MIEEKCMYMRNTSPSGCYYENQETSVVFMECEKANCYYKQLQRLKQENEKLKEKLDTYAISATVPTVMYNNVERERCKYGIALEEIREIVKKYDANIGDTIIANPIQDCYDIYTKINEVIK